MKKVIFSVIAVVMSFTLLFLVLEVIFRLFRGKPDYLRQSIQVSQQYLHEPNQTTHHQSSIEGEFEYDVGINQHGYRGENFLAQKPEGVLRIFAVGDSFTYGIGVEDDETIPAVMQRFMPVDDQQVEVINAGAGSTSTMDHYFNLKHMHLQYDPDLVMVFFDLTDLMDDYRREKHAVYNEEGDIIRFDPRWIDGRLDPWRYIVSKSKFLEWVNNKVVRLVKKIQVLGLKNYFFAKIEGRKAKADIIARDKEISDEERLKYDALLMMRGREQKRLIDQQWKRTAKYLSKIDELLEKQGIPWILVAYPHGIYVGPDEWSQGRLTWGFEAGEVSQDYYPFFLMESWATYHHVPFINTLDAFLKEKRRHPERQFFWDWDGHLNDAGYALVAEDVVADPIFIHTLKEIKGKDGSGE